MIHSRPFRSYAIACMLAVVATPASFAGSMAGEIHNAQQCFDYHYYNLRAVMSSDIKKAISKIQLNRAAVADFRRLKDELETEMRYLGLDVTKDSILSISQLA